MKLEDLCRNVAEKALTIPGTIVECMNDNPPWVFKGVFKSLPHTERGYIMLENNGHAHFANRFRKISG